MSITESYNPEGRGSAEWVGTREAAAMLFGGVKVRTLQVWAQKGRIPAIQSPGGTWKFRRKDLEAISRIKSRD